MKKDSKNRQRIQNVRARTRTLIVVAAIAAMICCTVVAVFAATTAQTAEPTYIYFDLAAGDVTITGTEYKGCAYKKTSSGYTAESITGEIKAGEAYYVYQSKGGSNNPDGYFTEENGVKTFTLPERTSVACEGKSWGDYITNNSNVENVITNWETAAKIAQRDSTNHRISVTGAVDNATIVIDNLWSSYHNENKARTDGGISFYPQTELNESRLTIKTKGDNRFGNIFYSNYNSASGKASIIFDEYTSGSSLTVADFLNNQDANYWDSAIGGSDATVENADGIIFEGGTVFAGTTEADDCTAIGGGGNGYGGITISGGNVTAVVTSSGAAIGGGIGKSSAGGAATVTITGGNVYAYNFSCKSTSGGYNYSDTNTKYIPSAAIGGGSSGKNTCNPCTVNITGGYVYAQSVGGTAIGGGSSADTHGGNATVTIGGTAKVEAKSIAGTIGGQPVPAGAAIGGGTGGAKANSNGGNVTLKIEGNANVTAGSIGGGKTNSQSGKIGSANVTMTGGTLQGQIVMAQGASQACTFQMSGGTIDNSQHNVNEFVFLQSDGGAIWMDDAQGTATLSGGSITGCSAINGGAVYMTAGTFNMSGGTISSCTATNGGAVYMEGGTFTMTGGEISSCTATDGAGVYLKDGSLTVQGGKITNNIASQNGGGAYLGGGTLTVLGGEITQNTASQNGGAFAVFNGDYKMTGGKVSQNKATNGYGGAVYVSSTQSSNVLIRSGEVTSNTAGLSGGALGIQSTGDAKFTVTVGSNTSHEGKTNCHECENKTDGEPCPIIQNNTATQSGGGIYLAGTVNATLHIYCIQEKGNEAEGGTSLSNFMKVEGGMLNITTGENGTQGNVIINSTIYVTDGQVTVGGIKSNPMFKESVTVDVQDQSQFTDNRTGNQAYTIQYFENFTQNGVTSGQYTMIDVEAGASHTVKASMYSHTGYDIDGWNLKENESLDEALHKANENITVNKHLRFYAKWSVVGYTVQFEPGVDKYQGSMESQAFEYNEKKQLSKNQYIYVGYDFAYWEDKNGKKYKDEEEVEGLSSTHGEIIVLTAQWEICGHNNNQYTVTKTENTATRECHCKGYSETVTITGWSGTYDRSAHPATVTYQYNSSNGKYATEQWKDSSFTITYTGNDNDGTSYNGAPENAGTCMATIKVTNDNSIFAQITINRATRKDLPDAPTYEESTSDDKMTITVTGPEGSDPSAPLEFRFSWYEGTELKSTKNLNEDWEMKEGENFPSHTLEKTYTNYYVEVRYKQTCNYEASDPVRSATSVVWTGYVTFEFSAEIGLDYYWSGNTDKASEGITVTLTPKDGYYIYEIKHTMTTSGQNSYQQPKLTDETKTGDKWTVKITEIQSAADSESPVTITINFSGAEKKATVGSAIVRDEVFEDIAEKGESSVTVSRDSAFTVQFTVNDFNHYNEPKIQFGEALPKGSTVIMIDREDNSYWSYTVDANGGNAIALTDFTRMGAEANDKYSPANEVQLKLQFIIDFSDCENTLSETSLSVSLMATPEQPSTDLKTVPDFPQDSKTVTLVALPTFSVSVSQDKDGLSSSLTYQFAVVSEGVGTSKWDARRGILCLTKKNGTTLPADARLQVKVGDSTAIYPLIDGKFIVSLPTNGSATAELTLLSDMLPNETVKMEFDVMLYSSETLIGTTPSTTKITNSETVTYSVTETKKYAVYAKIEGDLPQYKDGTTTELQFQGSVSSELPENYKVQASLYSKNDNGEYKDTTVSATVIINGRSLTGSCSFDSLGENMKNTTGSLSMMLKFELIDPNGSTVDSMPLYFILIDERQ